MTSEAGFISALRALATAPGARGLADDAAVLEIGGTRLVLTMDAIVETVHFLPDDPPEDIAWKLVATNVSDLSAKGAVPRGCLLSYPLAPEDAWDAAFLRGLEEACTAFAIPLLGGDTVRQPTDSARSFALVALGEPIVGVPVPARAGARAGDLLWVSAPIGDAGLGLAILRGDREADPESREALTGRYRRPSPDVRLGVALAPHVSAMMDVSDGILIDVSRLASASGLAALIHLDHLPLSQAFARVCGEGLEERLFAAGAGDDYCLLFAAPPSAESLLRATAGDCGHSIHRIGRLMGGRGLSLLFAEEPVASPARLGFEH